MTPILNTCIVIVMILLISCEQQPQKVIVSGEYTPPYEWSASSFEVQKIDSVRIDSVVSQFSANPNIYSLLIVRNGYLVKEYYPEQLHYYNESELRSATKSIISALVGIALQQGLIDSLDQPMISFFPEYDSPGLDPRKRTITVKHLLTMRAGFDFNESDPPPYLEAPDADRVKLIIELPLKYNPGERFYYGSVQTHLLSAIITKRSGMSTLAYAKKYLFGPAKINPGFWSKDPQGIYSGGSGLLMTPRNLARFGDLYRNRGTLNGTSIVPNNWVDRTIIPNNGTNSTWRKFTSLNYGLSWWTNSSGTDSIYFAAGSGGQFVIVVPQKQAVIVMTANPNQPAEDIDLQEKWIIDGITHFILPAPK